MVGWWWWWCVCGGGGGGGGGPVVPRCLELRWLIGFCKFWRAHQFWWPLHQLLPRPATCRHPAIPRLHDYFFDEQGAIELVIDLMEGEPSFSVFQGVLSTVIHAVLPAAGL